ncbi:ABC transporter substrate-binding protein [Rufibacter glacialis]|uniref:ABC transporter substrate-binding protein n=1 Tax=Rufibacter glacialis TaxID=1259555 RepID=A0A5M8QHY4_9BACT|nr:ABC transporter substrate-binding protein [Rufibacter glacialis]KAA6434433.1 ABC transporter substrate-binding protein [Rufibacter glacialis]GGK69540.1 iron transporter [Rufibacter glacialis]
MTKVITFLSVCLLLLSSCNKQGQENTRSEKDIVATDIRGKEVRLQEPAQRVIVLFQAALDGMYMLNAEHTIIGIQSRIYSNPESFHYFSKLDPRIARKELATPGNWENSANMESVIALNPDLVIVDARQTDAISLLENLDINVFAVSSNTNEELFLELEGIGKLTGTQARAKELLAYTQSKLEEIKAKTQDISPKKSVYYAWSGGRIYSTSGRNSRMNDCLELAGAVNACTFAIDQPNVNPETLISWDPDLILLWGTDPQAVYSKKELRVLKAVQNKEVYVLEPSFYYDPHTLKILSAAILLNKFCYADKGSFDLEESRKEIMMNLYGAKATALFQ